MTFINWETRPDKPIKLGTFIAKREMNDMNETYVNQLIKSCETIIKNARSIVGTESTLENIDINISLRPNELPNIDICKSIGVERLIDEK